MSTNIGCGWSKTSENGKTYISIALNKEILQLYPQLKGLSITAFFNNDRKNENSPHWMLTLSVPPDKKNETEDEIPI